MLFIFFETLEGSGIEAREEEKHLKEHEKSVEGDFIVGSWFVFLKTFDLFNSKAYF